MTASVVSEFNLASGPARLGRFYKVLLLGGFPRHIMDADRYAARPASRPETSLVRSTHREGAVSEPEAINRDVPSTLLRRLLRSRGLTEPAVSSSSRLLCAADDRGKRSTQA
jgi:hypothetical protein